jgi:hypothetical protein
LVGKEIKAKAETSALERIWRHPETERLVRSRGRVGFVRQKLERRQGSGGVLYRAVEWGEDEPG